MENHSLTTSVPEQFKGAAFNYLITAVIFIVIMTGFWDPDLVLFPLIFLCLAGATGSYFGAAKFTPFKVSVLDFTIIGLLFLECINYVLSFYPPNSFWFLKRFGFLLFLYFFFRFWLNWHRIKLISAGLALFGLVLSTITYFRFLVLQFQLDLEGFSDATNFKGLFSPFGMFTNEWATVALCLLPFPLIVARIWHYKQWISLTALLSFGLLAISLLVTFSRGAYLALFFFLTLLPFLLLIFKTMAPGTLVKGYSIALGLLLLLALPSREPVFTTLAFNKTQSQQRSLSGRQGILEDGLCLIANHPYFGVGGYNYPIVIPECHSPAEDKNFSAFTNMTPMQILIEKGVLGALAYFAVFLAILYGYWQSIKNSREPKQRFMLICFLAAFLSLALRECFFSSLLHSSGVMTLFVWLATISTIKPGDHLRIRSSRRWNFAVCGILTIFALFLWTRQLQWNETDRKVREAIHNYHSGHMGEAAAKLKEARGTHCIRLPVHYLLGLIEGQLPVSINKIPLLLRDSSRHKLQVSNAATQAFEKALSLNPLDGSINFSLGWLHFIAGDKAKAEQQFNKAIALQPYWARYYLGRGMLYESQSDTLKAFDDYKRAVRYWPKLLDAPFFADLRQRFPTHSPGILDDICQDLNTGLSKGFNPILAARLGKVLMVQGDFASATRILTKVTKSLPSANRPYYNLGRIALMKGDTAQAYDWLKKAAFLSRNDYSPAYHLARLNYDQNNFVNARFYYLDALLRYLSRSSQQVIRQNLYYKHEFELRNDHIPKGFLLYTEPYIDFKEITQRLAEIYTSEGNHRLADYYLELSTKDLIEDNLGPEMVIR